MKNNNNKSDDIESFIYFNLHLSSERLHLRFARDNFKWHRNVRKICMLGIAYGMVHILCVIEMKLFLSSWGLLFKLIPCDTWNFLSYFFADCLYKIRVFLHFNTFIESTKSIYHSSEQKCLMDFAMKIKSQWYVRKIS